MMAIIRKKEKQRIFIFLLVPVIFLAGARRVLLQVHDGSGNLICPNGRKFHFKSRQNVYKNKYGRTEEIYECESCRTYADFLWLQPLQIS